MSKTLDLHATPGGVLARIPGEGIVLARGASVPADGTAKYAAGCIFMKSSGNGIGTTMYVNEGSVTSCDFNAK